MNLPKIIAELEAERNRLDQAILALERLAESPLKRRGRQARSSSQVDGSVDAVPSAPKETPSRALN